ncbi:MAG: hypothetical protein ACJ790_01565 [Myxococcaceae bacterium]
MRLLAALVALTALTLTGCPKEISSEERLDRETQGGPTKDAPDAEALAKINCKNIDEDLAKARSDTRPETDRVLSYIDLYQSLQKKTQTFEEAMSRNPDLSYKEGSQEIVGAKDTCIQQTADVRVEFERYIRDLVEVPVVDEVKGGTTVKVARLDFGTLKQAIEVLSPDDKDQLLSRVASAEKRVEPQGETGGGRKKNK